MMFKTQPRNIVIVKPFPANEQTASGLFIPETAQERKSKATVMAIGAGLNGKPMKLKVGQTVYHVKGGGEEIIIDDEKYYVLRDTDCLATELKTTSEHY